MKCTHTSHYSIVDSSTLTLNVTNSFNLHLEEAVQLKHFPVYHGHTSVFCVLCPHLLPPSPLQKNVLPWSLRINTENTQKMMPLAVENCGAWGPKALRAFSQLP